MIARSGKVSLFILSLLLLLVPVGALGQTAGTGQIVGTVTDKSGAVVVDATVTLTDTATNDVRTTTSNDAGRYAFPNVVPGKYNVSINKAGFKQTKLPDLEVLVSETRTLDVRLDIGSAAEVVEVTSTNTEMQTMNATIGNTITGAALDNLPGPVSYTHLEKSNGIYAREQEKFETGGIVLAMLEFCKRN